MGELTLTSDEASDADEFSLERPASVYARIREDIIEGRIAADSRLKVRDLAARYEVSTNPIREALQQLRGEGFVVITPNRGARVRTIDEEFLRDTNEIELLIEPYLTRWFADVVTNADIAALTAIQQEIEALNFADIARNSALDTRFHSLMYERHPNQHILDPYQAKPPPGRRDQVEEDHHRNGKGRLPSDKAKGAGGIGNVDGLFV